MSYNPSTSYQGESSMTQQLGPLGEYRNQKPGIPFIMGSTSDAISSSQSSLSISRSSASNDNADIDFPDVGMDADGGKLKQPQSKEGNYSAGGKAHANNFVSKVFNMLNDPSTKHIRWTADGRSFIVTDQDAFTTEILPKRFKHSNFANFVRQLNMYDFHKTNRAPRSQRGVEKGCSVFSHPKFQRGRPDLLSEIRRKDPEAVAANPQDGYDIPPPAAAPRRSWEGLHFQRGANSLNGLLALNDDADTDATEEKMDSDGDDLYQQQSNKGVQGIYPTPGKMHANNFVSKTFNMLEDPNIKHISWTPDGRSFTVTDQDAFSTEILPKHFKHRNFSSFVRQLNMYDFHRTNRVPRSQRGAEKERFVFAHPKFQRGRPDLLPEIRRKVPDDVGLSWQGGYDVPPPTAPLPGSFSDELHWESRYGDEQDRTAAYNRVTQYDLNLGSK